MAAMILCGICCCTDYSYVDSLCRILVGIGKNHGCKPCREHLHRSRSGQCVNSGNGKYLLPTLHRDVLPVERCHGITATVRVFDVSTACIHKMLIRLVH
jgi:hypothetical protein